MLRPREERGTSGKEREHSRTQVPVERQRRLGGAEGHLRKGARALVSLAESSQFPLCVVPQGNLHTAGTHSLSGEGTSAHR